MTDDGSALLAAIIAHPAEDTPRLVYADWLDENGQHERAEFIRVQVELSRGPDGIDCRRITGRDSGYDCYPLDQTARRPAVGTNAVAKVRGGMGPAQVWLVVTGTVCGVVVGGDEGGFSLTYTRAGAWQPHLVTRERELWEKPDPWGRLGVPHGWVVGLDRDRDNASTHMRVRRGFVESVTCSAADWLEHGDAIRAAHPVTKVVLTTVPKVNPVVYGGFVQGYRFDGREHVHAATTTLGMLETEWPGVDFELPSIHEWVAQGNMTNL